MKFLMRNKYVNVEGKTKFVIDIPNSSRKTIHDLRKKISLIDCEDKQFEMKYNNFTSTIMELMKNKNIKIYNYQKNSKDGVFGISKSSNKENIGNFEKMNIDKNTFIETVLVKNL